MKTKIINRVAVLGLLLLMTWIVTPLSAGSTAVQQSCNEFTRSLINACLADGKEYIDASTPATTVVTCGAPPTPTFDSVCSAGGGNLVNILFIGHQCTKSCT